MKFKVGDLVVHKPSGELAKVVVGLSPCMISISFPCTNYGADVFPEDLDLIPREASKDQIDAITDLLRPSKRQGLTISSWP